MKTFLYLFSILFFICQIPSYAQEDVDIITQKTDPFQQGAAIEGSIQNSINEVSGKVVFSVPVASLSARDVSYSVGLTYNGQTAFETAKNTNAYSPTSTVGVGFHLAVPKIMTDHKNTATREDDTFYLLDGDTNAKLVCVDKIIPEVTGDVIWEFQTEKYAPWKIRYFVTNISLVENGFDYILQYTPLNYWVIVDDKGIEYIYGNTVNSRENLIAWGNWMGDSNRHNGTRKTIVWNLAAIQDQWNNRLSFIYEHQQSNMLGANTPAQTEAVYIKTISSSSGGKIEFTYADKTPSEYAEPHTEQPEPDAYQERYEKKFLQNIKTYNIKDNLLYTYSLGYLLTDEVRLENNKRYLTHITQSNAAGENLPPQAFEYYLSGDFKGGIQKITYPMGGSVTYNYQKKTLFYNDANRFLEATPDNSGYEYVGVYVRDHYVLRLYKSQEPTLIIDEEDGVNPGHFKYQFKVLRYWWNGSHWLHDEFVFPHLLEDRAIAGEQMDQFLAVFEEDFYGFLFFDRSTDSGNVYLFHQNKDGYSWDYTTEYLPTLKSWNESHQHVDPVLLSGDEFVAVATSYETGELYTYVWNGSSWNEEQIQRDPEEGKFHYGAANNYIMVLDRSAGADIITGVEYPDKYYIHYLDATKTWQTRSWSGVAHPHIADIVDLSYLYPDQGMLALMADNNPEWFLRWDKNYNLIATEDIMGVHPDNFPVYPALNSTFTIQHNWYKYPERSARFNGDNWAVLNWSDAVNFDDYASTSYGEDLVLSFSGNNGYYGMYNANTGNWSSGSFIESYPWYFPFYAAVAINRDFFIIGNVIYKRRTDTNIADVETLGALPYDNAFSFSNGYNYSFVKLQSVIDHGDTASFTFEKGMFYFINKETGQLDAIDVGKQYHQGGHPKFGGYTQFLSAKSMWLRGESSPEGAFSPYLYRIIDDGFDKNVYDNVVDHIIINNGKGETREMVYRYDDHHSFPNNQRVFYGEVIIENRGYGTDTHGKIKRLFNNGATDIQLAGLLLEEHILDIDDHLKQHTENIWNKNTKSYYNSMAKKIGEGQYIRLGQTVEALYFGAAPAVNTTNYHYNNYGVLFRTHSINSKGYTEETQINYAYEQYSFVANKNMISAPYETRRKINDETVAIHHSLWGSVDGKVYPQITQTGTSEENLRILNVTTRKDDYGNTLESSDGKNRHTTILYGYGKRYPVAVIQNATYNQVIAQLDLSYEDIQILDTEALKAELLKLYDRLPYTTIKLSLYNDEAKVISSINHRKEEIYHVYDAFGNIDHTANSNHKILAKKVYHYKD